jgi:RimJ/RimL family protein N-acetyltransferase
LNNTLYILVIVFSSIYNIFSNNKKNKNNIKKKDKIEINPVNNKLLKIDKINNKRLNFAGIDKDTYEVMNSYILKGFETERLKVNFTTEEDIEKLGHYFEDIEMLKYTDRKEICNHERGKEYLRECNKRVESYYFCIKKKEDNEPIGQINIKFYEPGVMTMSYWIGKKFRRNGYMSEIGLNFTEDVFFNLKNIKNLQIYLLENNKGSKAYAEKLYKYLESKHKCHFNVFKKNEDNSGISTLYFILEKDE